MSERVSIPYVSWRNGRPRFEPSPTLRKQGHRPHDLKTGEGAWMTAGQALDWSNSFSGQLEGERQKLRDRKARDKRKATAAVRQAIPRAAIRRSFTLGQLLEAYLRNGTADNANSANTIRTYRSAIRCVEECCPDAWFSEAAAISRRTVKGMYRVMKDVRSNSIAHMAVHVMSIAYNWTIDNEDDDEELITSNPAERIRMQKPGKRKRPASVAEYLHLLATAEAMGARETADMLLWGVWTGQRTGDRLAMLWSNLRDGRLEIVQQKTRAEVSIPLAAALRARLGEMPLYNDRERPIIPVEPADKPRERLQHYWRMWQKLIRKAAETMPGIADLRDQDLRDTAISWMGRAGCTIPEIYAVSGHKFKNETAIMGHYMALDYQVADNAIRKLETWVAREVKKLRQQERKAG